MGPTLVLFYVLVLGSVFVDSFAFINDNKHTILNSNLGIHQPSRNPYLAQYKKQEGYERQPYESSYYSSLAAKQYGNPISNNGNLQEVKPTNDRYVTWGQSSSLPRIQSPTLQKADTVSSAGLFGNNQRLYQIMPAQIVGKPYNANGYVKNYAKPYVNQANYAPSYPYYQSQTMPVSHSVSSPALAYRTEWVPSQNQYPKVPNSVEYLPLPVAETQKSVSTVPTTPKDYNTPQYIAVDPVPEYFVNDQEKKMVKSSSYSNDQDQINSSQPPVIDQPTNKKRYVIVHANNTYEHVDNIDHIVVDEFNIARIKSKAPPNHILAIIEVEDAKGTESQINIEDPYDTGISKIPQNNDGNSNNSIDPGMLQRYEHPLTQDTTKNPIDDMVFFKPEYLMPIQITTEKTIDSTTYSPPQDLQSDKNTKTDKNYYHNHTLFSATDIPTPEQNNNDNNTNNDVYITPANVESVDRTNKYTLDIIGSATESAINNSLDTTTAATQDITTDTNKSKYQNSTQLTNNIEKGQDVDTINEHTNENSMTKYTTYEFDTSQVSQTKTDKKKRSLGSSSWRDVLNIDVNKGSYYDNIPNSDSESASIDDEYNNSNFKEKSNSASAPTDTKNSRNDLPFENSPYYGSEIISNEDDNNKGYNGNPTKNKNDDKLNENSYGLKEDTNPDSDAEYSSKKETDSDNDALSYNSQYESESTIDNDLNNDGILVQRSTLASVSSTDDVKNDSGKNKYPEDEYLNIIQEPKLRDDLNIDVSQLKTELDDQPVVWFRRDPSFWDKVTKGENSFDALTIYDVNCKPVLIERITTIRYFPNGTKAVDYVETLWDSLDAPHPREIKANREYRDS